MKKNRRVDLGILNITIQPHNEDLYISLFNKIFRSKIIGKYHGDRHGIISKLINTTDETGRKSVRGEISVFTKIDIDGSWLDIKSLDEASESDIKEIKIPDHLKPNLKKCAFIFDAQEHRLYFERRNEAKDSFGFTSIESLINKIFNHEKIIEEFNDVAVNLIPDESALDKLLSYPQINKIEMRITPPNPDDLTDIAAEVMKRLNLMNVKNTEQSFTSRTKAQSINLDEDAKNLAKIASTNGFVKVTARNIHDQVVHDSTIEHPKQISLDCDADETIASALIKFIKKKIKK